MPPGGAIEQLGFDLLRCILAADVEQFYHCATNDVRDHSYHPILPNTNPMDLMFLKHHHPTDTIILDQWHVIDLINQVNDKTSKLAYYINKAHCITVKMKEATKWMKMVFPKGPNPMKHSEETEFNVAYIIGEVESDHQEEHMPSYHYAACRNQCIHCTGTHASEDHHLSLGIPIVSNSGDTNVLPHWETKETSSANSNASNEYKTKGQLLLSQQNGCCHDL